MTAEQPRKPELHMSPIKQGFAFNAEGGGGIACGITDLGNGKRLLTVKHVQVPDELMNQGRGGQLYNRAVQEGIARGATELFAAFQQPSALRIHFRLFGDGVSRINRVTKRANDALGLPTASAALDSMGELPEDEGSMYTKVDLTNPTVLARLRRKIHLPLPPTAPQPPLGSEGSSSSGDSEGNSGIGTVKGGLREADKKVTDIVGVLDAGEEALTEAIATMAAATDGSENPKAVDSLARIRDVQAELKRMAGGLAAAQQET